MDDLRQRLIDVWAGMQQSVINDAVIKWHRSLIQAFAGLVNFVKI